MKIHGGKYLNMEIMSFQRAITADEVRLSSGRRDNCKDSRTVCLYCSLDGDKIAEFVGYLHVRRLLACSSATCISVGYSTYMCQFSFNIKAPLFVCSSLALNLLTTRLVNLVKLASVLDLVFFLFLLILHPFRIPFHVCSALGRPCRTLAFRLSPASPLTFSKLIFDTGSLVTDPAIDDGSSKVSSFPVSSHRPPK